MGTGAGYTAAGRSGPAGGRATPRVRGTEPARREGVAQKGRAEVLDEIVARRTGLIIDPYFSASKVRWLLDNLPGLREPATAGEIASGTIDNFLLGRLCGGRRHATDVTNASRTMMYDIAHLTWDADLLDAFGIPPAILPEVLDTAADYGSTTPELLGGPIPIAGIAGDQQAALIGQACFRPGMVKSTSVSTPRASVGSRTGALV